MTTAVSTPAPISRAEFVALMAMLVATVAFSIDAMLPAMGVIAGELSPLDPNRAQLVITSFVFGMGVGTFLAGPLSDSFGRIPVVLWGAALYAAAAALAWLAPSLEWLLAARVLQGLGASAARVVPMAITRDYYKGRGMARITSFIMMVFTLVPAIAPLMGSFIIAGVGWRGLFASFMGFAALSGLWLWLRVPEPLPPEARRPFRAAPLIAGVKEVLAHPIVRRSTMIQTLCMVALFASLSTIHQLFDVTYHRHDSFPYWFGFIALVSGGFSLLNASVVVRLGMRLVIRVAMLCLIALTVLLVLLQLAIGGLPFALYILWQGAVFVHTALTLGNLNAIALEPMGHLAGTATSVFSALATIGSVLLTVPIGLAFNGTPLPLMLGTLCAVICGFLLMRGMPEEDS